MIGRRALAPFLALAFPPAGARAQLFNPGAPTLAERDGLIAPGGGIAFDFMGGTLPPGATLTRASTAWYWNSASPPQLTSAAINAPRWTYSRTGAGLEGLLNEPAATNSIRNSSGAGGTAGSPGAFTTNWTIVGTPTGWTRTMSAAGSEDGIPYAEFRYVGVPAFTSVIFAFDGATITAAAAGQTWSMSAYVRLMAGTLGNMDKHSQSPRLILRELASNGAQQAFGASDDLSTTITNAPLRTQLVHVVRTFTMPLTTNVQPGLFLGTADAQTAGTTTDFTIRIGAPQMVQAAAPTSTIFTPTGPLSRAADVLSLPLAAGTYDLDVARLSGMTTYPGVASSGGFVVVPTDPSPLTGVIARRTGP